MIWLLGALGAVRRALSALWGLARANPALAAIVLLAGLSGWLWWGWNRADGRTAAALEQVAKWKTANDAATQWAMAEKSAREVKSRTDAERITREHTALAADTRSAADRFIAANRLRPEGGQCRSGAAPAAPGADSAEVHPAMPADAVVVGASDVRACSDWVAFGIKARETMLTTAADTLAK